jgi:hypothetical protein
MTADHGDGYAEQCSMPRTPAGCAVTVVQPPLTSSFRYPEVVTSSTHPTYALLISDVTRLEGIG